MKMKDTLKKLIPYAFVGVISGATTFGAINYFNVHNEDADFSYFAPKNNDAKYASFNMTGVGDDFVKASKMTVPAVVSIKNYSNRTSQRSEQDLFDQFWQSLWRTAKTAAGTERHAFGNGFRSHYFSRWIHYFK